jgi:hypothetical protein
MAYQPIFARSNKLWSAISIFELPKWSHSGMNTKIECFKTFVLHIPSSSNSPVPVEFFRVGCILNEISSGVCSKV